MPNLIFHRSGREVLRAPLTETGLRVGRHPSNDLALPDEEISRSHVVFAFKNGSYEVIDQSRNGTSVNGRRIKQSPLKNGDEIRMGSWRVVFSEETPWGERETVVKKTAKSLPVFCGMIGKSDAIRLVFSMIEKVAPGDTTVLIFGETGSGKELAARAVHELSPRASRAFVALNCGAISPQLIESELFGHERGAFTGAAGRHAGAFEQASGGTLFLDEVGELPLELQPKLLRVLEEKKIRRVGGIEEVQVDVRVVAATHRHLENLVGEGKFREDLYFRLFAVPIPLPPLRDRQEDIRILVDYFMDQLQGAAGAGPHKSLSPEAFKKLMEHSWRGNIRELKNVVTRSLLFSSGDEIRAEEVLFLANSLSTDSGSSLGGIEKQAILTALQENDWNKKKTATALGIAKSTLFNKIKEYQIKNP